MKFYLVRRVFTDPVMNQVVHQYVYKACSSFVRMYELASAKLFKNLKAAQRAASFARNRLAKENEIGTVEVVEFDLVENQVVQ
jgi:hypothetical protein